MTPQLHVHLTSQVHTKDSRGGAHARARAMAEL